MTSVETAQLGAGAVLLDAAGRVLSGDPGSSRSIASGHACLPTLGPGDDYLAAMRSAGLGVPEEILQPIEQNTDVQCPHLECAAWWRVAARPLREGGGTVITHADVTEQVEEVAGVALERTMQAVERLVAGVAHDLNNVLTGVLGYADLLAVRPDNAGEVDGIRSSVNRARALVGHLVTFSRYPPDQAAVLEVGQAVTDLLPLLREAAGNAVELRLVPPAEPALVRLEKSALDEILLNIVLNAHDSVSAGGSVSVRVTGTPHDVTVLVRDDGAGMDAATAARAVEPFFTTKPSRQGLGLSVAYALTRQAGGRLRLSSRPGEGTVVTLRFPVASTVSEPAPPAPPAPPAGASARPTVLIVEDEDAIREVMASLLSNAGYDVMTAADGAAALAVAGAGRQVDVVVTDVTMPAMGGVELVQRLRVGRPGLAAVFMTGYTAQRLGEVPAGDPAPLLLRKPFGVAELTAAIRSATGSSGP